jgi:alpha-glucosidase (family GH31 glycosyl hydrolase)
MSRVVVIGAVAAAALTGGCAFCGLPPLPVEPGLAHADGTVVVLADGDGFPLTLQRDGVVVGGTSRDSACPGLVVGLRRNDDSGGWIDPARADALDLVDVVGAARTTVEGATARIALQDAAGGAAGHAELTLEEGPEGFVLADVAFFDDDGAPLDERDVGFVGLCLDVAGQHIVGGGERFDGPDLAGRLTPLVFSAPGQTESGTNEAHAPVPFLATSAGLALLVETERVGAFDAATVPGILMARFHGASLPLRLRAGDVRGELPGLRGERITDNVAAHARLMGLPQAPPRWALAPMQWRNDLEVQVDEAGVVVDSGTDMLLRDVAAMVEHDLPFSTVWIDAPWETGYNTFVVNEVQLPGFDDAVDALTQHGLVPLVWATEHVNVSDDSDQAVGMPPFASEDLYEEFRARGFLVENGDGEPFTFAWGRGQGAFVDFTNADACAAWQATITPLLGRGIKGFKLDYGETMRPDVLGLLENTLPVFADGTTTAVQHTRYARLYHECFIGALQQVHGDDWFIITRTGGHLDQKNGVAIWPGDLDADFSRLGDESDDGGRRVGGIQSGIGGALSLAMSGYPLYGHDVGGYRGDHVTPEAFARWAEAGALQTIMQVGGGSNHAPWDDDLVEVIDAFAAAARLKMSLWPMYEAGLAQASAGGDGTPLMVPLGVFMGADDEAWADPFAVVLFDRLAGFLVVEDGARERSVRVPGGDWIVLSTGARLTGPLTTTLPAPLGSPPLLLRAGQALVLDETSDTLLPVTAPGRDGPSDDRVVVVSPGPASETTAGGLVVHQTPDGDGAFVTVTRTIGGRLTLKVAGVFTEVVGSGVADVVVEGGFTVVTIADGVDALVTLQP